MKTTKLFFLLAAIPALFITQQASAKIWRINNTSNYDGKTFWGDNLGGTRAFPVFSQIEDAQDFEDVSKNGTDTLYLEGTGIIYNGASIIKKLVIISTGYFLNENPKVSNTILESQVGYLSFDPGSEGSQAMGVHIGGSVLGVSISASNILIKRCEIENSILVAYNIANITIVQNCFPNYSNSTNSVIIPGPLGFPTNFIFNNNICKGPFTLDYNNTIYNAEECNNNVFDCPAINGQPSIQLNTTSFKNNILKTAAATVNINNNVPSWDVSYNISASATNQFGTSNHNIIVANMSKLFVAPGTSDGMYQLKKNSPGSNNGSDGADRGAFGGAAISNQYILSGLAPIPVIYELSTSGAATPGDGLSVTISAKTIK